MCSYMVQDARTTPPPPPKEEATDTFGVDPLEEMQGAIAHVAPLYPPSSAQCLRSASGNGGLGLGGMKEFRHGKLDLERPAPNPHAEGLSFFQDSNRGGGYYRMKMSICASAFESDACLQVIRVISMFRFYVAHSQPFYISSCNYRLVISTRRWFPMCG
jgi:hypothetical protein